MTTQTDQFIPEFVLATKLYPPPSRADLLSRPQLVERLQANFQQSLTLLCAPAGFGKSTLLSEWAHSHSATTVWLSLDESDNEPAQFMRYFIAAIQTEYPNFAGEIVAALQERQPPPLQSLFPRLLNAIHALPERFALVLDDYHLIENQPIHNALTFLLLHMPPTLHLVISSRSDPPFPLARLRVQRDLNELRVAELRFTRQEISSFFQQRETVRFSPEQLTILEQRTEGWPAGLQLAALSVAGRDPQGIDQFVAAFRGDHQYIFDYLMEEVLAQQTNAVRLFLLQTAILDRLCASLCNAVTEGQDGQAMLADLARVNLFLIPLDEQRQWYRYHHLFAEFLQQRLAQEYPEVAAELHQRASAWYRMEGQLADAIRHALAGADWPAAAAMLEEIAWQLRARGEYVRLRRWMNRFPSEFIDAHPRLCQWYGFALAMSGEWQAAEHPLQIAVDHFNETDNRLELAELLLTQVQIANFRKMGAISEPLARRALTLLATDEHEMLTTAYFGLGRSLELQGKVGEAQPFLEQAATLSHQNQNLVMSLLTVSTLGAIDQWQGRLRQAHNRYQQCLDRQAEFNQSSIFAVGLRLGILLYEWNRLEEAAEWLQKGIEMATRQRREGYWPVAHLHLARIHWAQGNWESGQQSIMSALELARAVGNPDQLLQIEAYQARAWLSQAREQMAAEWLEQYDLSVDWLAQAAPTECFQQQTLYLTWVRWLVLQDRFDETLAVLNLLTETAIQQGRHGDLIQIDALQALAHHAAGNPAQAQERLSTVLIQAIPEGYIRTFVDLGEPMAMLLRHHEWPDTVEEYVATLLAAFSQTTVSPEPVQETAAPVNGLLSERELEIMHLVADGLTAPQMADELIISIHTMRTHLKNIYRKLEVNSRVQAVEKAHALGLL